MAFVSGYRKENSGHFCAQLRPRLAGGVPGRQPSPWHPLCGGGDFRRGVLAEGLLGRGRVPGASPALSASSECPSPG